MVGFLCAVAEKGDLASTVLSEMFSHTTQIEKSLQTARPQLADGEEIRDVVGEGSLHGQVDGDVGTAPFNRVRPFFLCGKGPVFWSPSLLRELPLHPDWVN